MRVVVVGGGAAGMIAAWRAASLGHAVTLVEANGRLGVKVRISGGGKCNITHSGSVKELLGAFPREQARFLRPAFHAFGNAQIIRLLEDRGVATYVRENGRVFPEDRPGSAAAVVEALAGALRESGVRVRLGARVIGLQGQAPRLEGLRLQEGDLLAADHFVLATGGASYPETGTRGEVLGWLRELDVPVHPWFPALAPIPLVEPHPEWEGVALRDGTLHLRAGREGKRLARFPGDVLYTRNGITGPAALELSRDVERSRRSGEAWLEYAATEQGEDALDAELQALQAGNPHLAVRTWLQRFLPERMATDRLGFLGLPSDQRMKDLPRSARRGVVSLATAFPIGRPGPVPLTRGEVAAGGVVLDAVDAQRMRLKTWENLSVCGELLDIDGSIGGYNLQAAFSTGFLAGSL